MGIWIKKKKKSIKQLIKTKAEYSDTFIPFVLKEISFFKEFSTIFSGFFVVEMFYKATLGERMKDMVHKAF